MGWMITNAVLPGRAGRWSIAIDNGRIASIGEGTTAAAAFGVRAGAWDAGGRLVSAAFVDAHLHLDKALTADRVDDAVAAINLAAAINAVRTIKSAFTPTDVAARAKRALELGLAHGTTIARTNCEADPFVELRAVEGMQTAATEMAGRVDLQIVAFPQEGWFETPGTMESGAGRWITKAVERGVRIVGGNVNKHLWPSDPVKQVDETFELAERHDCDIDYHLDNWDLPEVFTLPYLARKTIAQGWQGRVAVAHIASLSCVNDAAAADAIDAVVAARISVCVLPTRMRLTRVLDLMEAGANVVCGTDNLRDPFVRYGDADPLKALLLLAQLTNQLHNAGLERLWTTMTDAAARMLRVTDYGLTPGSAADLVVFDAPSAPQAILQQGARLAVIKRGVQVAGSVRVVSESAR
jgi:cytosine deaminase